MKVAFGFLLCLTASLSITNMAWAGCVQPVTCVSGYCENQGPPVCSGPSLNIYLAMMTTSSGDIASYFPPGGGAGAQNLKTMPKKLDCAMEKYADIGWQPGWTQNRVDEYGWTSNSDTRTVMTQTNVAPLIYPIPVMGDTALDGSKLTTLYRGAFGGQSDNILYIDPANPGAGTQTLIAPAGGWSPIQWEIVVGGHEAAHQKLGAIDEKLANGYGVRALNKYNADGGAKCAGVPNISP